MVVDSTERYRVTAGSEPTRVHQNQLVNILYDMYRWKSCRSFKVNRFPLRVQDKRVEGSVALVPELEAETFGPFGSEAAWLLFDPRFLECNSASTRMGRAEPVRSSNEGVSYEVQTETLLHSQHQARYVTSGSRTGPNTPQVRKGFHMAHAPPSGRFGPPVLQHESLQPICF